MKKTLYIIWCVFLVLMLIISYIIYYWNNYPFPWKKDFKKNGEVYIEIINLLNQPEYNKIKSFWWKWNLIQFTDSSDNYREKNGYEYEDKYNILLKKLENIDSTTYFKVCQNWYIKISKWWRLNNFFDIVYIYSKNWFQKKPELTDQIINDNFITYFNYDWTYSESNSCNVK